MFKVKTSPIDEESFYHPDEIIVSKTDLKGRITYANDVFCRVAEMSTKEAIGAPHNIIRHPDMPRSVFKLLCDTLDEKNEIFAYVKNMSMSGKYYWVLAHVTPSYDKDGKVIGYHSNRRCPTAKQIDIISPIYEVLCAEEKKHPNPKEGLAASCALLEKTLNDQNVTYSEFVWSIGN